MRAVRLALGMTALLAVGCAHRAPDPAVAPARTARAPEDLDRLFAERMNAGDLDGLVSLYEGGATLVRTNGTPATGHAAIRAELQGILGAKPRLVMNVKMVRRGGDNIAVLYNDWHGTATTAAGKRDELRGCAIEVVRRQPDGRWLYVVDDPDSRACAAP
jgi:uncharacterized protein (TIGR02246 family)